MGGFNKNRLDRLYQSVTYQRLASAQHVATIHYHEEQTASGQYVDQYLGEYIDGRDPFGGDIETEHRDPVDIVGQTFTGFSGGRGIDGKAEMVRLQFGSFQPEDIIFQTLEARVPADALTNVRYIKLSTHPGKRFRYVGAHAFGLVNTYTTNILLRASTDATED